MKLVKSYGKIGNRQAGQVLPMALVLLAAAIFIVIPVLFATQIGLAVNNDSEKDGNAYYAAEAGIANALWKFKSGTPPFTSSSVKGDYYDLTNPAYKINGMTVRVSFLKYSSVNGIGSYIVQSAASSGSVTPATIVALITQTGSTTNTIFKQALASLNGTVNVGGSTRIISDNMTSGSSNYGNIYAKGNIKLSGSAMVGGMSCPAKGIASSGGTVTVGGGACVGSKVNSASLISYSLTISDFTGPALAGTNYTSQASQWSSSSNTYNVGPGYVNGDVTMGGSNIFVLKGNLYVKGNLSIGNSAQITGPYTVICDGILTIGGSASALLAAGNIPFIISLSTNATQAVNISNSGNVSAIIYAANGGATMGGSAQIYGSVIANGAVDISSGSAIIKYLTGITSETQIPGTGTGSTASLVQYDYQ